jgi:hypothetical protein
MKKFFAAVLIAATLTTSAFAADVNKVSEKTVNRFKTDFESAKNVDWTIRPSFVKASFIEGQKRCEAFYDLEGEFIGCSKAIDLDELPTSAKRTFAKKYSSYTVKEAIKFDGPELTSYYISAENDKESVVLKVESGFLTVFKKTGKN